MIFLLSPRQKKAAPRANFVVGQAARAELIGDAPIPDDRARQLMGEHGDETGEVDRVAHRTRIAPIDVDRVAHRLKRVERDADRQGNVQRLERRLAESERRQRRIEVGDAEIVVLEVAEDADVREHRNRERGLLGAVSRLILRQQRQLLAVHRQSGIPHQHPAADVVDEGAGEHQQHPLRVHPAVERVADADQHQRQEPERQRVGEQQNQRQEVENEQVRAEDHPDD